MTDIDRGELTQQTYWDQHWSRLKAGSHHTDLDWIRRTYLYASLDRLLRSVLPVDPTKTFVELGSGPGRWLIYFHRVFGYQVSGCDYSPASCVVARENLARAGVPGTICQADFFEFEGRVRRRVLSRRGRALRFPGDHPRGVRAARQPGGVLGDDRAEPAGSEWPVPPGSCSRRPSRRTGPSAQRSSATGTSAWDSARCSPRPTARSVSTGYRPTRFRVFPGCSDSCGLPCTGRAGGLETGPLPPRPPRRSDQRLADLPASPRGRETARRRARRARRGDRRGLARPPVTPWLVRSVLRPMTRRRAEMRSVSA